MRQNIFFPFLPLLLFVLCASTPVYSEIPSGEALLFEEDFSGLRSGPLTTAVGAHTEYHYLPVAGPKGQWHVSTFVSNTAWQRAWRAVRDRGFPEMEQTYTNRMKHSHPMIVAGDELWGDYTAEVSFTPRSEIGQTGMVFRYRNDRRNYFFGLLKGKALLKRVDHATAFRVPDERILGEETFEWSPGDELTLRVRVTGDRIEAGIGDRVHFVAEDSTFPQGKIGLVSDGPARFSSVKVTASPEAKKEYEDRRAAADGKELELQRANPKMVLWKKFKTEGVLYDKIKVRDYGVGRNLRFGDLNGDGETDVLFCQPLHHGPKDRNSEVGCLTATTFDGKILWQKGEVDPWKDHLTNDVGVQIHDLDGDGTNEVIYCKDFEIVVAEGSTGKTKYKAAMPDTPKDTRAPYNRFGKILGDAIYFCDFRGTGRDSDILIKNRYQYVWALNDRLETLWQGECVTGHYPFAYDVDGDGKDEISVGYSLFDDDGTKLWTLDDEVQDHADGVAIVNFNPEKGDELRLLCAASDEGMFFAGMDGKIIKHHYLGHIQNPSVANLRDDLPGLEAVSINFWGNQGIVNYYDSEGDIYHDFEPCQHGSMMLPINWNGSSEEFFVLSPNVEEGGLFDGWGRRVALFPPDGHPDLCNAVLDITGDCRDEIVVWDPHEVWVYTQDDNPKEGTLYKPERNSLSNYSNYQATVSLPGWSE